ncbi:hypothetical protein ACFX1R_008255 [Malus domestica]
MKIGTGRFQMRMKVNYTEWKLGPSGGMDGKSEGFEFAVCYGSPAIRLSVLTFPLPLERKAGRFAECVRDATVQWVWCNCLTTFEIIIKKVRVELPKICCPTIPVCPHTHLEREERERLGALTGNGKQC